MFSLNTFEHCPLIYPKRDSFLFSNAVSCLMCCLTLSCFSHLFTSEVVLLVVRSFGCSVIIISSGSLKCMMEIVLQCMWKLDDLVKNPSYDCPKKGEAVLDLVIEQLTLVKSLMKGDTRLEIPVWNVMQFGGDFYIYTGARDMGRDDVGGVFDIKVYL